MVLEVMASEAAKAFLTATAGAAATGVSAGAGKLWQLVRGRVRVMPKDHDALTSLILRQAEQDAEFAGQLADGLAELEAGRDGERLPAVGAFFDRDAVRDEFGRPGIWLVAGAHGVGKTALALRIGHDLGRAAYVDLDPYRDGAALRVTEVQREVMRQLGVQVVEAAAPVVADQYLRALLYRRFVLVLDNVAGSEEARQLAQPWPASTVVVTTRFLSEDLRIWCPTPPVVLHGLDQAGGWALLAGRCGEELLRAEPHATSEILNLCDWLPYPILQVGVRLARRADEPGVVANVLAELRRSADIGELIEQTVADLTPASRHGLAALSTHPGGDFTRASAAALLGRPATDVVDNLLDACVLIRTGAGRLQLPWLVRQRAGTSGWGDPREVDAGFDRVLAFYRDRAVAVDLAEGGNRLRRYTVPEGVTWPAGPVAPIDWLEAEAPVLVDLVARAHHRQRHVEVTQLCGTLEVLLNQRGQHWLCATANDWGIRSAEALGDRALTVRLHQMQGRIFTLLHLFDRAEAALGAATDLFTGLADPQLESSLLESRARLVEERRAYDPAPDYSDAVAALHRCLAIDRQIGDDRAFGLHARMLANVLVKQGRAEQALALLADAAASTSDARNDARVHTVRAKAFVLLDAAPAAAEELRQARLLAGQSRATQYEVELADIEADIALRTGDVETARLRWAWIAERYCHAGHPLFYRYLAKLNGLPVAPR